MTADSVPVREWEECLHKAAALIAAAGSSFGAGLTQDEAPLPATASDGVFESVLIVESRALRLPHHLSRLDRSCRDLWSLSLPDSALIRAHALLEEHRATGDRGRHALRVLARLDADGEVEVQVSLRPLGPRTTSGTLLLGARSDVSWRHKWVNRQGFAEAEEIGAPALPYFLAHGHLAETTRGNLFVRAEDGVWCTPPLDDALLPGVTRRAVLDFLEAAGTPVRIEPLAAGALHQGRSAFWTSSLSGVVTVTAVDGRVVSLTPDVDALIALLNGRLGVSDDVAGDVSAR